MTNRQGKGRPKGRPFFALACLSVLLLFAGCGDDGGDETTSVDTKDQFITQADQICTEGSERIQAGTERIYGSDGTGSDEEIIKAYEDVAIPGFERIFDEIGALEPPPGDEDQIDEILDTADEAIAKAKKDPAQLAQRVGLGNPLDDLNPLLQSYGFQVCGGGNA